MSKLVDVTKLTPKELMKLGLKKISHKECTTCGESKPADEFVPSRRICKPCKNAYLQTYYAQNKDRDCYKYKPKPKKDKKSAENVNNNS